ncbi:MAG: mucoidy inhibitor MuiA family protein [Planctomycetaceae bacterium]|nr:mucoidy inhibitor MuiA family protein [Planctomycetaceae bacterium]
MADSRSTGVLGRIEEVTFYRGQALVTRVVPLEGAAGGSEVVVGPLPEQIVPESLFAESRDGAAIRAVRFRCRPLGEEPREEVRKLDEAMGRLGEQRQALERDRQVIQRENNYLDAMDQFVQPTMKTDLAHGVLDAAAMEKLLQLSFQTRESLAKRIGEVDHAVKENSKQMQLLQRKRTELTAGARNAVREALVFVEKPNDAKETFRLSYLVNACSWSPSYTIRAGKDRSRVAVECNAVITQITGEDWDGVRLVLSTATPALSASGPGLAPLPILLTPAGDRSPNDAFQWLEQARTIQNRKAEMAQQGRTVVDFSRRLNLGWELNAAANDLQALEMVAGKKLSVATDTEGPSLSYPLAHAVSLPSRRDPQTVRIMQTSFPSEFYHVATPVLGSYVYREAALKNQGDDDLLAGPITVYLDGRFVGRGEIPTVARGQTFVVGLGADPQLRTRRELVDRNELVQGGNRELSFKYRLILENFKTEAVPVRLFDRIPYSDRTAEVRIKLGETKDPLSVEPLYVRTERPKNILRWDLTVPAGATAEKARFVEYGFTVEFDRNLTVGLPQTASAGEAESMPCEQRPEKQDAAYSIYGGMKPAVESPQSSAAATPMRTNNVWFRQFELMQRTKAAH